MEQIDHGAGSILRQPPITSACAWMAITQTDIELALTAADRVAASCPGWRRQRLRASPMRKSRVPETDDELPWERGQVEMIAPQTHRELRQRRREDRRPAPPAPPKMTKPPKAPKPKKTVGRPGRPPKTRTS